MKIVSLELAKELKEAGFPQQDSEYYWTGYGASKTRIVLKGFIIPTDAMGKPSPRDEEYASPTADEILDLLPGRIRDKKGKARLLIILKHEDGTFYLGYECSSYDRCREKNHIMVGFEHQPLADAATKMWLYLKEHLPIML